MYVQEKDYIMTGIAATVVFAIFGPAAILCIWFFVGIFCLDYRHKMKEYKKRWGDHNQLMKKK